MPVPTDHLNDYRFGYSDDELERLGDQHRIWAEENQQFLDRAGFREGATLVDLGCGPGYTTLDLARTVGPKGRVIAVDRDGDRSLSLVKERAHAAGFSNIETRLADLETFDLPENSVDGVYGRWVLMYLPGSAVRTLTGRMARWLKPGGVCGLAELCNFRHIHVEPPCAHLPFIAEALMRAVTGNRDCNPEIGNLLPGMLDSAGLDVRIHVATKAVRATTPEWRWPDALFRDHGPALVEDGYVARKVLDEFMTEWDARSRNPEAVFFGSPVMEVLGQRPPTELQG